MIKVIKRLERWIDAASNHLALLSVLSLVILTVLITVSVVMRYVFNDALTWSDEIAAYCLVAIVYFGLSHTLIHGGHIRIDVVVNLLSERAREWLQAVSYVIGIGFSVFLVVAVYGRLENFWTRGTISFTELETPLFYPALPLMVGAVMLLLTMLIKLLSLWIDMARREAPPRTEGRTR